MSAPAAVDSPATVQSVLDRYRSAFTALDPAVIQTIWPGVDAGALRRAFGQLREQTLEYESCNIVVNSERALAVCSGTLRYVPSVGSGHTRVEKRQWDFQLRTAEDGWIIEALQSR